MAKNQIATNLNKSPKKNRNRGSGINAILSRHITSIIHDNTLQESYKNEFLNKFRQIYQINLKKLNTCYKRGENVGGIVNDFIQEVWEELHNSLANSIFDAMYDKINTINHNDYALNQIEKIINLICNNYLLNYDYDFYEIIKQIIFNFGIGGKFSVADFKGLKSKIENTAISTVLDSYFNDSGIKEIDESYMKQYLTIPATLPEVFIIESLHKNDTEDNHDGKKLYESLKFVGRNPKYFRVSNRFELSRIIDIFKNSKYRFLHISCHASKNTISLTEEDLSYKDFSELFTGAFTQHRIFFSACELGNQQFMGKLFADHWGKLHSVVAPKTTIQFYHAHSFWLSFYTSTLQYKKGEAMTAKTLLELVSKLMELFPVQMAVAVFNPKIRKIDYPI